MRSRGKSFGATLGSGFLALACAFGVWEGLTRTFIQMQPPLVDFGPGGLYYDGRLVQSEEGYGVANFTRTGFRKPVPKGTHKHTVLVLGDSYTEAIQVADSETFVSVAGANLKAHGLDAAFFNAGVSGGAPPRYIALADYYKKLINPDAVVISLNDSDYTVDYLDKTHIFAALKDKDSYKMVKLGKNSKQKLMASPIASKLLRSSLVQIAAKKLSVGERRGGDGEAPKAKSETPRDEIDRYIRWTVAQFKAAYPNLVLAYVPKIDYFQPEKEPPMLEQLLENACKDEGVTLINMRKRYQTYFRETGQPCHGFPNTSPGKGHINAIGHQLLADEVSHELERRYSAG